MNSALARRSRSVEDAATDYTLFLILVGASMMGLVALAVGNWAISRPTPVAQAVDSVQLLPLAEPVKPLAGFHDLEHLPNLDTPARQVEAGTPQAKVDLPLTRWDWGNIPKAPPVQQTFPIQNWGNAPLIIRSVVTSCGCTMASLSSSVIPPGQRADLVVTFDPAFHETSGPVTRLVWLATNDPAQPVVELRMDAHVVS